MRKMILLVFALAAALVFAGATQAQPPKKGPDGGKKDGGKKDGGKKDGGKKKGGKGGVTADSITDHILSFDKEKTGKVTRDDLPERMQNLVDQGDANKDNALDRLEIQSLAAKLSSQGNTAFGQPGPGAGKGKGKGGKGKGKGGDEFAPGKGKGKGGKGAPDEFAPGKGKDGKGKKGKGGKGKGGGNDFFDPNDPAFIDSSRIGLAPADGLPAHAVAVANPHPTDRMAIHHGELVAGSQQKADSGPADGHGPGERGPSPPALPPPSVRLNEPGGGRYG